MSTIHVDHMSLEDYVNKVKDEKSSSSSIIAAEEYTESPRKSKEP